jgi:hypothetical protein
MFIPRLNWIKLDFGRNAVMGNLLIINRLYAIIFFNGSLRIPFPAPEFNDPGGRKVSGVFLFKFGFNLTAAIDKRNEAIIIIKHDSIVLLSFERRD